MANDQIPGFTPDSAVATPTAPIQGFTSDAEAAPAPGTTGLSGFLNKVGEGGAEAAGDIWSVAKNMIPGGPAETGALKTIWNNLPPVQLADSVKQTLPLIHAYETARASGSSISDALTATNEAAKQHMSNIAPIQKVVSAFRANPTRETARALTDAAALAASMFVGGEVAAPEQAEAAATAASAPAAATETAEAETAFNAASKPSLAQQVAQGETAATPVEVATAKAAAKSKLPAGSPVSVAPTGEEIQPTLQQGIRDSVNQSATNNGFDPIPDSVSIRNVPKALGDQAYVRSKATFDAAEKITGINFTTLKNNIFKLDDQISDLAITDPEKAGQLTQQKLAYEEQAEAGLKAAEKKGVDVGQARNDWNTQLRANELSNHVRNSAEGTTANPVLNPTKLTPRLQKMNEAEVGQTTPKLTQLMGEDTANQLVETAENARGSAAAIKDFEPTSATGQKAMQDILRPNTGSRVIGSGMKTNFLKSLDDFEKLSPAEQAERFPGAGEVEQARSYLKSQARWQVGKRIAAGLGLTEIARELGITSFVIHALME